MKNTYYNNGFRSKSCSAISIYETTPIIVEYLNWIQRINYSLQLFIDILLI